MPRDADAHTTHATPGTARAASHSFVANYPTPSGASKSLANLKSRVATSRTGPRTGRRPRPHEFRTELVVPCDAPTQAATTGCRHPDRGRQVDDVTEMSEFEAGPFVCLRKQRPSRDTDASPHIVCLLHRK